MYYDGKNKDFILIPDLSLYDASAGEPLVVDEAIDIPVVEDTAAAQQENSLDPDVTASDGSDATSSEVSDGETEVDSAEIIIESASNVDDSDDALGSEQTSTTISNDLLSDTDDTPDTVVDPDNSVAIDATSGDESTTNRTEVVLIQSTVTNADDLAEDAERSGAEVYFIDPNAGGLTQTLSVLENRQGNEIDALHIISHGSSGELSLGNDVISSGNLTQHESNLGALSAYLSSNADILIYGCDVGQDSNLIESIAELTEANIAASTDDTGAGFLGGDTDFEVKVGDVQTPGLFATDDFNEAGMLLALPTSVITDQLYTIQPTGLQAGDYFGWEVRSLDDQNLLIAAPGGFPGWGFNAAEDPGKVYWMRFNAATDAWDVHQTIQASDESGGMHFGSDIEVTADGSRLVVGASHGVDGAGVLTGAAYVFDLDPSTGLYLETAKLLDPNGEAPGTGNGNMGPNFGNDVGIADDGQTIVVGAPQDEDGGKRRAGTAHVFTLNAGTGDFDHHQKLTGSPTGSAFDEDKYGYDIRIEGDIIVTGQYEDSDFPGRLFIYELNPATELYEEQLETSLGGANSEFGRVVEIHNGKVITNGSGNVYVYEKVGGAWTQTHAFNPAGDGTNHFDVQGDILAIGVSNGQTALYGVDDTTGQYGLIRVLTPTNGGGYISTNLSSSGTYAFSGNPNQNSNAGEVIVWGPPNIAPVATDNAFSVNEDGPAVTGNLISEDTGSGVDSDADGDATTVSSVNGQAASVGSTITLATGELVTVNADGSFTFDPNGQHESLDDGETATVTFNYQITDGLAVSNTATVTFTVNGSNDAPTATPNQFSTTEDETNAVIGNVITDDSGSGIDADPDGDSLAVACINGQIANVGIPVALPGGGLVTVSTDGSLSFNANGAYDHLRPGESVTETVSYEVSDGTTKSNTANLSIVINGVNDAPVATNNQFAIGEDESDTVVGNVINNDTGSGVDSDAEGDAITVSTINGQAADVGVPVTLPGGEVVTLLADGSLSFNPNGQHEGLDDGESATVTFDYQITDGSGVSSPATVTLTVNGANDTPVATDNQLSVDEDAVGLVLGNVITDDTGLGVDSDPDGESLTVACINGQAATVGSPVTLSGGGLLTVNADGTVSFDANGAYNGLKVGETVTETITYQVSDGTTKSNTATLTITVNGTNDTPVPVADPDTSLVGQIQDNGLTISNDGYVTYTGQSLSVAPDIGVLINDTDPDGDTLTITAFDSTTVEGGTLVLNPDGSFSYTPPSGFIGIDSATYTVDDGNGGTATETISFSVIPTPVVPLAVEETAVSTRIAIAPLEEEVMMDRHMADAELEEGEGIEVEETVASEDGDANIHIYLLVEGMEAMLNAQTGYNAAIEQVADSGEAAVATATDATRFQSTAEFGATVNDAGISSVGLVTPFVEINEVAGLLNNTLESTLAAQTGTYQ